MDAHRHLQRGGGGGPWLRPGQTAPARVPQLRRHRARLSRPRQRANVTWRRGGVAALLERPRPTLGLGPAHLGLIDANAVERQAGLALAKLRHASAAPEAACARCAGGAGRPSHNRAGRSPNEAEPRSRVRVRARMEEPARPAALPLATPASAKALDRGASLTRCRAPPQQAPQTAVCASWTPPGRREEWPRFSLSRRRGTFPSPKAAGCSAARSRPRECGARRTDCRRVRGPARGAGGRQRGERAERARCCC